VLSIGNRISAIVQHDAFAGVLLMSAAAAALAMDNSPLRWVYDAILTTPMIVQIGTGGIEKPLLLWINDGLMAIFFFLVGLEIKREVLQGRLASWTDAALPVAAAIGGMAVPAAIYTIINLGSPSTIDGWAIPAATDIAFALGLLALVGSGVPPALKVLADWVSAIGLDPLQYGTHSIRRTKATLIYRRTGNLRAVQLLLGHTKVESTVRYLGVEVDDALAIAEQIDI
jgi:NhaA family Na+:H+ antiporter